MQYVVLKDEETGEVEFVGRFKEYAVGEIWLDDKWRSYSLLVSDLHDGLLENISEEEADRLITKMKESQLQAA